MTHLEFKSNDTLSLGVEVEIQLVDKITGDLKPVGLEVLKNLPEDSNAARIKSELFQSMLEIDTPICKSAFEVGESLRRSLALVRKTAFQSGAEVMMAGTHPYAHYSERLLTPAGRYYGLVDRNKWIARRLQIFGLHVHIGMKNGDHAIQMNNAFCHYLPLILALSASSPFWHRDDTGLASSRITFFEAIPTGGHPCLVNNWSEFEKLIERLIYSKSITGLKDLWWDIRPNIDYGTIEIRIADCPPTIKETEALVALIHSLAVFIDEEISKGRRFLPPPEWILRENKWRASRHGISCDLIYGEDGTSIPLIDIWNETRKFLSPIFTQFHYHGFSDFLSEVVAKGPSYLRQRKNHQDNLESVVRHLIREGTQDHPEWKE